MNHRWKLRFIEKAQQFAAWSKDYSTQVGAVAVDAQCGIIATGYNGLPRRVSDLPERYLRPAKYLYTVHAEANLVADAARRGTSLLGSHVLCTHAPCAQCAALLINAGIASLTYNPDNKTSMPDATFAAALEMLTEAGVAVTSISPATDKETTFIRK